MLLFAREQSVVPANELVVTPGPSEVTYQVPQSQSEYTNEEADLRAQESMAAAAWFASIVSGLALVGLGLTVFYARKAWVAAKETIATTQDVGEQQNRAYVVPTKFEIQKCFHESHFDGQFSIAIQFDLKNFGSTPALNVTTVSRIGLLSEKEVSERGPVKDPTSRGTIGNGDAVQVRGMVGGDWEDILFDEEVSIGKKLWVRGYAEYSDIFGQKWRQSFWWVSPQPEYITGITPDEANLRMLDFNYVALPMVAHIEGNDLKKIE